MTPRALPRGLEGEISVAVLDAVTLKVVSVDREHFVQPQSLSKDDERGIREVHWAIRVLNHELERTSQR